MTPADPTRPTFAQILAKGLESLEEGNLVDARGYALRGIRQDPLSEEAWLLLAAASPPHSRGAYIRHASVLHPESREVRQALAELEKQPPPSPPPVGEKPLPSPEEILAQIPDAPPAAKSASSAPTRPAGRDSGGGRSPVKESLPDEPASGGRAKRFGGRGFRWAVLLISISCLLALSATAFAGVAAYAQEVPVMERVVRAESAVPPTFTPSFTPTTTASFTPTHTHTFTPSPTHTATNTLPPTNTPWPDAYIIPGANGERWIDIDISSQSLTAYEGNTPIRRFIVSTGTAAHPTVLGRYRIYAKLRWELMIGPGYYLPNVPFTMYFYRGYAIHGTYWHHNFGTPMSHGCVNMYTPDAEWMFYWASVGTLVNSHW
jgi:lipoprotein-anchoring transpeptidase ErfK/SrfK